LAWLLVWKVFFLLWSWCFDANIFIFIEAFFLISFLIDEIFAIKTEKVHENSVFFWKMLWVEIHYDIILLHGSSCCLFFNRIQISVRHRSFYCVSTWISTFSHIFFNFLFRFCRHFWLFFVSLNIFLKIFNEKFSILSFIISIKQIRLNFGLTDVKFFVTKIYCDFGLIILKTLIFLQFL